nr:PAS and ANTAR domain-containing protein [Pseudarthrobacter psychrotolerans]
MRGDVVPTVELLLAHKHAEARPRCAEVIAQVLRTGGYFCIYHRIMDARGRFRRVLTTGDGMLDPAGKVTGISGLMIDLTETVRNETDQAARDAVAGVTASRSEIDQARGILMGRLLISAEEAFDLLVSCSSRTNVKVATLSAGLVDIANSRQAPAVLDSVIRKLQANALPKHGGAGRAGALGRELG